MKSPQMALLALVPLAAAGCRADPGIALLERELRLQEDRIFSLQDSIEELNWQLESARRENTTLRKRLGLPGDEEPSRGADDEARGPDAPALQPPTILLPSQSEPPDEIPETLMPPDRSQSPAGPIQPGPVDAEGADTHAVDRTEGQEEPLVPADSSRVVQVLLSRSLSGGFDADGRPGDEGLAATLQLRDSQGRRVRAAAEVTAVLLDPALEGEAARVARWDFSSAETAAMFRSPGPDGGLRLQMPWPSEPPEHERLHLYVRYTTADGRRLEDDVPVRVRLASSHTPGWLPMEPSAPKLGDARPPSDSLRRPEPLARPARTADSSPPPARLHTPRPIWSPYR